jgi:transcriptional regulator with XRE-family HTH domain
MPTLVPLKRARQLAELTQEQLEALSGVDRTNISQLERVNRPLLTTTREALDAALRKAGGLQPDEELVFGWQAEQARYAPTKNRT